MQSARNATSSQAQFSTRLNSTPSALTDRLRNQARERAFHFKKISSTGHRIALRIAAHVYRSTLDGWMASISQNRLADEAEVSRSTIHRQTRKMAEGGFIRIHEPLRRGDTCRYELLAIPCPPVLPSAKTTRTDRGKMAHDIKKNSPSTSVPVPDPVPDSKPFPDSQFLNSSNTDKPAADQKTGSRIEKLEKDFLTEIRKRHVPDPHTFWTWYAPITVDRVRDGILWLGVPNRYFVDKLRPNTPIVLAAARSVAPHIRGVHWLDRSEGMGGETAGLL